MAYMKKILFLFLIFSSFGVAHAEDEFRSIKFNARLKTWNCPAGFSDIEVCEEKEEELPTQKVFFDQEILGFLIGEVNFQRELLVPLHYHLDVVLLQGDNESPDDVVLESSAGFQTDYLKNAQSQVEFTGFKGPPWTSVFSGFQTVGDREIAVLMELTDVTLDQRTLRPERRPVPKMPIRDFIRSRRHKSTIPDHGSVRK